VGLAIATPWYKELPRVKKKFPHHDIAMRGVLAIATRRVLAIATHVVLAIATRGVLYTLPRVKFPCKATVLSNTTRG